VPDYNAQGELVGEHFEGCNGRARQSAGYLSRDNVIKAKILNRGTDVWEVEHECKRPKSAGMIYDPEQIQAAVVPAGEFTRPEGHVRRAVGVDWGRFAVAVLAERGVDHVAISEGRIFDSRPISDLVQYLVELRARVGDFVVYADAENAYANLDVRSAGFELVSVAFNKYKDEGIENLNRYFAHGKLRIKDEGALQTVVQQLLRYHRNEQGKIVKKDDHGPDALLCAALPFPFIDEFDTAISQMLSGTDRERLKVTTSVLDGCIREDAPACDSSGRKPWCTMGVSMGANHLYAVASTYPIDKDGRQVRVARYIGKVRGFEALEDVIRSVDARYVLISLQPEPHLVNEWAVYNPLAMVYRATYLNDGTSAPRWDEKEYTVAVDRNYALNSAYEEITHRTWLLPPDAREIDGGEFYAQMKAPTRVRDLAAGEVRYRWVETGSLDHYRHAHALDHLMGQQFGGVLDLSIHVAGESEALRLARELGDRDDWRYEAENW
ncbi:hypothetical protein, partial [Guyparkeria sp.]|uniref:hypothetical protein n=1 Tax=Guyparkeria sp. TaxID=2035736 RepID=UPI003970EE30